MRQLVAPMALKSLSLFALFLMEQPRASAFDGGTNPVSQLQANSKAFQERLRQFLNSPANPRRAEALRFVDLNQITVKVEGSAANLANAGLQIHYELQPGATDSPQVEGLVKAMVLDFLKQSILDKHKRYELHDRNEGLSRPMAELLSTLGYPSTGPDSWTPESSFDVAYACYIHGLYADAVVIADRGLALRNHARLQLVKGVCQLHLEQRGAAQSTAVAYRAAVAQRLNVGLESALERVNEPLSVQFHALGPPSR